jgi:hypothetical protein
LAACGGAATPQLIGSYPEGGTTYNPPPVTDWSPPPQNLYIAYNASLELEVDHPSYAVYSVRSVAEQFGGYLLTSRTWTEGGDEYAEATVAVPVGNFETVKARIESLGDVKSESISGEIRDAGPAYLGGAESFSSITVSLKPVSWNWLKKTGTFFGWVFSGLFWLLVWLTPPFLMLVGLVTCIRTVAGWVRARNKPPP